MSFVNNILKNIESSLLGAIDGGIHDALSTFGLGGSGIINETVTVPGDVDIIGIRIVDENKHKPYDIRDQVKTIDIYEDILSPSVFCVLGMQDGVGVNEKYAITGDEYIAIDFMTPGNAKPTSYMFRTRPPSGAVTDENNKFKTYTLEMTNPDVWKNAGTLVNRTIQTVGSEAVHDILTNELSTQMKINVEETKGLFPLVCSMVEPYKAIDMIRVSPLSLSKKYDSHAYLFFQNKNGYNFLTLEKLMHNASESLSNPFSNKTWYFDNGNANFNVENVTMRNILNMEYVQTSDPLDMISAGGLYTKLMTTDMITGKRQSFEYKMQNDSDKYWFGAEDGKGGTLLNQNFMQNHSRTTSNILHVPISSGHFTELGISYDPTSYAEKKINTLGFISQATQSAVLIEAYGDTDVTAGDGIKCYLPPATGLSVDEGKTSKLTSGNYVVAAVRHMIVNSSRPQHIMSMALIRGTLGGK